MERVFGEIQRRNAFCIQVARAATPTEPCGDTTSNASSGTDKEVSIPSMSIHRIEQVAKKNADQTSSGGIRPFLEHHEHMQLHE